MKRCWMCKTSKPKSEFHSGCNRCKPCDRIKSDKWKATHPEKFKAQKKAHYAANPQAYKRYARTSYLRVNYGLTQAQYDAMLSSQDGRCAICSKSNLKLEIDHDHSTGNVRQLLCRGCNVAVSWVEQLQKVTPPYRTVQGIPAEEQWKPEF